MKAEIRGGKGVDEGRPDKHEDFIEPGSKEDQEIARALHWALDEVSRETKEQYRKQKEAAEMERERRTKEGLPLRDDCYFARFTRGMYVSDEDLRDLWQEGRIAVNLTESGLDSGALRSRDLDPKDYPIHERSMVRSLVDLSRKGGYVWFENRSGRRAKVGVVRPDTPIESTEARWSENNHPKHKEKAGTVTTLRTLRLEKVRHVHLIEATMLRASRPMVPVHVGSSLRRWWPACGTFKLISMIDEHRTEDPEGRWNALPPTLQLTVCADFLRYHRNPAYPNIKHLLLDPTTKNSKDVDIYGMTEDGTEVMAQTPFRADRDKEGHEAKKKAGQLRKYRDSGAKLICFVPAFRRAEDAVQDATLFEDRSPIEQDGVLLIPVQEVLDWVRGQPAYSDKLLSR